MTAPLDLRTKPQTRRTLWGPLAIGVAVVALWDTPLVYPLKVLTVMLHEMCHALATLATGGQVLEIKTRWDESGHTLSRGGWAWLIYPAGYLGTALLGSIAILIRRPATQPASCSCSARHTRCCTYCTAIGDRSTSGLASRQERCSSGFRSPPNGFVTPPSTCWGSCSASIRFTTSPATCSVHRSPRPTPVFWRATGMCPGLPGRSVPSGC